VPVSLRSAGSAGGREPDATAAVRSGAGASAATAVQHGPQVIGFVQRVLRKFSSAGWAFADQCIVSAANFLTIYLFARYLSTSSFGIFMLAHTGLLLMTSMQTALVVQPHNVLAAGLPQHEYQRFTGALLVIQATGCVAVCVALGLTGWFIKTALSPAVGGILIALALAAVPWMGQEFVRRVLYTRSESRAAALNDSVTYGLQFIGALALVSSLADSASPEAALLVLGGSSLAGVLLGAWQLRDHVRLRRLAPGSLSRTWAEIWNFGKWLTGQNTLVWLGTHGHSWIVGLLLGAEQVGFYRAATHIANVMNPLRQAAYSYLPARGSLVYQAEAATGLSRWVRKTSLWLLLALVPFYILLVGFPGAVLSLAYGERYAGADLALILALSTIGQCLTFSKFPLDIGLLALRATKAIFYVHLIPVFLLFTAGVGLIYFLGILGVPLSGILINLALLAATWIAYTRNMRRAGIHAAV
jgi:O-antigen/teichoic acid export membrane protein